MGLLADVIHEVRSTPEGGCFPWPGERDRQGYGRAWVVGSGRKMAHRAVYEALVGPIPAGLQIDHLCRVKACVNPRHLEPVTPAVNVRRATGVAGTGERPDACRHGHAYDAANTYVDSTGYYFCRTCNRAASLANYHRKRALL